MRFTSVIVAASIFAVIGCNRQTATPQPDPNQPVTAPAAAAIVERDCGLPRGPIDVQALRDVTPAEVWTRLQAQVFDYHGYGVFASYVYLIHNGQATRLGGWTQTDFTVLDRYDEERPTLIHVARSGSGISHCTLMAWCTEWDGPQYDQVSGAEWTVPASIVLVPDENQRLAVMAYSELGVLPGETQIGTIEVDPNSPCGVRFTQSDLQRKALQTLLPNNTTATPETQPGE